MFCVFYLLDFLIRILIVTVGYCYEFKTIISLALKKVLFKRSYLL